MKRRWWPDLALAVVAAAGAALALRALRSPTDDAFWQIAYGRAILAHHALPAVDTYSWTAAGHAVVVTEWAFDTLLAAAVAAGPWAAYLLAAICILALGWSTLTLCTHLSRRRGTAGLLALGVLLCVAPFETLLPQLASFGLLALVWAVLESARSARRPRALWLLPPLFALWANVHGTFYLGLALVALDALLAHAPTLPGRLVARYRRPSRRALPWVLLASAAATLANPYGWRLYGPELALAGSPFHLERIAEFQSPNFHMPLLHWVILPALLLALGVALGTTCRLPAREVVAALGLLAGSLVMVRLLPYALVGLAALAAGALRGNRQALPPARWWQLGVVGVIVGGAVVAIPPPAWPPTGGAPVAAAAYVRQHLVGRGFNTYEWGGYLLWVWRGDPAVYVDSRGDMYDTTWVIPAYTALIDVTVDPSRQLRQEGVTWALLPKEARLATVLRIEGWTSAFSGGPAVVLLAPAAGSG